MANVPAVKRIAIILLCPFLAPALILAVIAFAYTINTPDDVSKSSWPGNDMLGAFFLIASGIAAGIAQLFVGIPFCLILMNIRSRGWRIMLSMEVALIPVALYCVMVHDAPLVNELIVAGLLVVGLFAIGAWLPFRWLHPVEETSR